ncbi:MAG: phosphatidate cytidylyltransferase [Elusimicrobia bacterium]|nr:phosphatidate cytidylyltransferase [Elusimicrobiota bacterium]
MLGIPLILFMVHLGSFPFMLFVLGIIVLSLYEYGIILSLGGKGVQRHLVLWGGTLLALSALLQNSFFLFLTLCLIASMVGEMFKSERSLERVGLSLLGILLIAWTLSHLFLLRDLRPFGEELTYLLVLSIWIMDSAAYFIGTLFGKRKLAASISPGKTWEGTVAGFLTAIAISYGFCSFFLSGTFSPHKAVLLGLLIGVFGQISDLAESIVKRSVGVKDSSHLLPGHGGVLDRFDSFLFTAPLLYYTLPYLL